MRMALEGRISLSLRPPGYNPDQWAQHPDIEIVEDLLAIHKLDTRPVVLLGHICFCYVLVSLMGHLFVVVLSYLKPFHFVLYVILRCYLGTKNCCDYLVQLIEHPI